MQHLRCHQLPQPSGPKHKFSSKQTPTSLHIEHIEHFQLQQEAKLKRLLESTQRIPFSVYLYRSLYLKTKHWPAAPVTRFQASPDGQYHWQF